MKLVLRHARIDGDIVDVLVADGVIEAVGPDLVSAAPQHIDLEGRVVVPGLWDEHVHLGQQAFISRQVDVSAAASALEAAVAMSAAAPPEPGITLSGFGFRDGLWPDKMTPALLDAHVGDLPTVLVSGDLHCCWLNTAALAKYGLAGHSTGVLREDDAFAVTTALADVPPAVLDRWAAEAAQAAAARGVVGVVDLEMADNIESWTRRFAAGFDTLRIDAGIYTEHLPAAVAAGLSTGTPLHDSGLLRVGPFKILIDGSLNTRTAFCADDYPAGGRGMLTVEPERLVELMRLAASSGIMPVVHAIGDEANRIALDAFEAAGCRGRIEHAQFILDADLPRFAQLGVVASVQPEHALDDRDVADVYWAGRTGRAFPLRSLADAGAQIRLGSDAPVAPLDPWVTIAAAVGRTRGDREPWHPEQALTVAEAVQFSTRTTFAAGQPADLAVLDADPFECSLAELRAMPVAATMVAGRWTHANESIAARVR